LYVFNIIARKTLLDYCKKYPEGAKSLHEWYHEMVKSNYRTFNKLKKDYPNVSIVGDDRVVFNVLGNRYRLVVRIVFEYKAIQVKWFGSHAEYDKVNVEGIKFKKS